MVPFNPSTVKGNIMFYSTFIIIDFNYLKKVLKNRKKCKLPKWSCYYIYFLKFQGQTSSARPRYIQQANKTEHLFVLVLKQAKYITLLNYSPASHSANVVWLNNVTERREGVKQSKYKITLRSDLQTSLHNGSF